MLIRNGLRRSTFGWECRPGRRHQRGCPTHFVAHDLPGPGGVFRQPSGAPNARVAFFLVSTSHILQRNPIAVAVGADRRPLRGIDRWAGEVTINDTEGAFSAPRKGVTPVSTTQFVIRAEGLTKTFGRFRALDGLDLQVAPGEVHGFLGPNGAGKSTTIRVVLGLIRASGGHVELFGGDPWRQAATLHERLAYVAGDVALWPGLTGGQCLDVLGATQGGLDEARRAALLERFDLDPTKRVRDYSKGNRQKVALIAALAADADLLVLDEPTSGLDRSWNRPSRRSSGSGARRAARSCCRATSSVRSRLWPIG